MTSGDIELALVKHMFPPRRYMVIPNASWGLHLLYEADLFVIGATGCPYEIEIKVSVSDFKRDFKKNKYRTMGFLDQCRGFYFAYPESIHDKVIGLVPDYAGAIAISERRYEWTQAVDLVPMIKKKAKMRNVRKLRDDERIQIGRLMQMRYWELRKAGA
jgi:hypothetical protein